MYFRHVNIVKRSTYRFVMSVCPPARLPACITPLDGFPWHKFIIKVFLCKTQYFILLTMMCSSTIHTECIVAFPLQWWLCKRATLLHLHCLLCWLICLANMHFINLSKKFLFCSPLRIWNGCTRNMMMLALPLTGKA